MPTLPLAVAVAAVLAALLALFKSGTHLWGRRFLRGTSWMLVMGLAAAVAVVCGAIAIGLRPYQALTHEEVAAVVRVEPRGPQRFQATVIFPDRRVERFDVAGDQLYVDAQILKWKPVANILGLHTDYALDRLGGRYVRIEDERKRPRTVYPLSEPAPVDLFALRRELAVLSPLFDAEYGSGTFVAADRPVDLEILVSTSGLLVRPLAVEGDQAR